MSAQSSRREYMPLSRTCKPHGPTHRGRISKADSRRKRMRSAPHNRSAPARWELPGVSIHADKFAVASGVYKQQLRRTITKAIVALVANAFEIASMENGAKVLNSRSISDERPNCASRLRAKEADE